MNYFDLLPIELNGIIITYLDDNAIDVFMNDIVSDLKNDEMSCQNLTKLQFPELFNDIKNISNTRKWKNIYEELIKTIPMTLNRKRIDKSWILYLTNKKIIPEGEMNFPSIIYEALFNKEFSDVYKQMKPYIRDDIWILFYLAYSSSNNYSKLQIDTIIKTIFEYHNPDIIFKCLFSKFDLDVIKDFVHNNLYQVIKVNNHNVTLLSLYLLGLINGIKTAEYWTLDKNNSK